MASKPGESRKTVGHPLRGEIYLVNFDPTIGHEIRKTRPALVIQNDIGNRYSPVTIVAAISSKFGLAPYPTEVVIEPEDSGLSQRSVVVLSQIRSVDRQRLIKHVGKLGPETMSLVDQALQISLGLVEL